MHGNIGSVRRTRIVRRSDTWTFKEGEVLRSNWPDLQKIEALLPHRSRASIRRMALICNLKIDQNVHTWTAAEDSKLKKMAAHGASRKEIATELNLSVQQVAGRLSYTGTKLAAKPPAPSGNLLVDTIRRRAYDLKMTMADLDRSLGSRKVFQHATSRRQTISPVQIHRAAVALGGRLVIEWQAE